MAKQHYSRSDETYDVLRGYEGMIAKEHDCDDSHIYAIKNGVSPDPYPRFRHLFRASARAGAPVGIWLHDLNSIALSAQPLKASPECLTETLLDKIRRNSDATVAVTAALEDKQLDKRECHSILATLAVEAENNRKLERIVQRQLAEHVEKES